MERACLVGDRDLERAVGAIVHERHDVTLVGEVAENDAALARFIVGAEDRGTKGRIYEAVALGAPERPPEVSYAAEHAAPAAAE